MREPLNRAQRRAAARAYRRMVKADAKVAVQTRFRVIDASGRDVTSERMKRRGDDS